MVGTRLIRFAIGTSGGGGGDKATSLRAPQNAPNFSPCSAITYFSRKTVLPVVDYIINKFSLTCFLLLPL
jgi:hypothetical protein